MGTLDVLKERISRSIRQVKSTNLSPDFGKVKGLIRNIKERMQNNSSWKRNIQEIFS